MMYLYHRRNSNSGARLAIALGWTHGSGGQAAPADGAVVRWGCVSAYPAATPRFEFNKPEAIHQAANKRIALEILERAEVPTPGLIPVSQLESGRGLPCVGRTDRHERGSGYFFCRTAEEVTAARRAGATHFMRYLETFKEYRVMVFFGRAISVIRKYSDTDWRTVDNPLTRTQQVAIRAVAALGLDFGAVDVARTEDDSVRVFEVNTAPDVDGVHMKPWIQGFRFLESEVARRVAVPTNPVSPYPGINDALFSR